MAWGRRDEEKASGNRLQSPPPRFVPLALRTAIEARCAAARGLATRGGLSTFLRWVSKAQAKFFDLPIERLVDDILKGCWNRPFVVEDVIGIRPQFHVCIWR